MGQCCPMEHMTSTKTKNIISEMLYKYQEGGIVFFAHESSQHSIVMPLKFSLRFLFMSADKHD